MKQKSSISRRRFLKGTAAAGITAAFPSIIPASALGRLGKVAPSNRIVMGCIGVGSQGRGNMNAFLDKKEVQVIAVCDVDKHHRDTAKKTVDMKYGNKDCKVYSDFRDLLNLSGFDALSLALHVNLYSVGAL